jgi:hypothetical protein
VVAELFPHVDPEEVASNIAELCWIQHGGSGLNITWGEAHDLTWDELIMLVNEVHKRREAEANAIRKASKA